MELPEDRLYKGAKVATDNLATYLTEKSADITDSKEAKLLMDTLKNVSAVAASLGDTREKRDTARLQIKAKGNAKIAYDQ